MKTILILVASITLLIFLSSCGGSTSVNNSNQQSQNQAQDEAEIQTAQEACSYCADKYTKGQDEESLSSCVVRLGFDVSDC